MNTSSFYSRSKPVMRFSPAFTLLELMITVAVIGIIMAVALPNYADHVRRGKIAEATSQLAAKQALLEQSFQDNRTYVGAPACTSDTTTSRNFDFTCPADNLGASTYRLLATGKDSMLGFSFALDQTNTKSTVSVPEGWSLPSPNNCWVQKRGGEC
ncbi:type IV pilin protein [Massilia sp. W12]|uniref:type IV pilin protein n=1 Tax=Massilia sp. W12 TaxID=3126507 RepID=UPI0030CDA64C